MLFLLTLIKSSLVSDKLKELIEKEFVNQLEVEDWSMLLEHFS